MKKNFFCSGYSEIYILDLPSLESRFQTGKSPYSDQQGKIRSMAIDSHNQKLHIGTQRIAECHWDISNNKWVYRGSHCSLLAISQNAEIVVGSYLSDLMVFQMPGFIRMYKEETSLGKEPGVVTSITVSHDGSIAYCGHRHGVIKLYCTDHFESIGELKSCTENIAAVALSPDESTLASGGEDGSIQLWDLATQSELLTLPGHEQPVESLSFTPDGTLLVSAGIDGNINLWGEADALVR